MSRMRNLFLGLFITICIIQLVSSCTNNRIEMDFQEVQIENGYNNYLAGASLARIDSSIYYRTITGGIKPFSAFKISNHRKEAMLNKNAEAFLGFSTMFYQYNNSIYSFGDTGDELYLYNQNKKEFSKCSNLIKKSSQCFMSKDLQVYFNDNEKLCINYKNNTTVPDIDVDLFYISGSELYILSDNGYLYCLNLNALNHSPKLIDKIAEDAVVNKMIICGDYVYYDFKSYYSEKKDGLHRYSLIDKKDRIIKKGNISSINKNEDRLFFVANNEVYFDNINTDSTLLTSQKTDEIYIFDKKWIYLFERTGVLSRVSQDGKIIERITG